MARRGAPPACRLLLGLGATLALATVCSAVNVLPYQVPFLKAMVKSQRKYQNWTLAGARQLGWAAPWNCDNITGVVCDTKGNIVDLIMPGTATGEADDSCFLLPLETAPGPTLGQPKGCPFPVKITGPLPASIADLSALTALDISSNLLNGTFPSAIFNLTKLQILKLYDNLFEGTLPKGLSLLTNLQNLDLSYTKTFRPQPLPEGISAMQKLTKLKLLAINANGTIPDSYSMLTNIESLQLGANRVTGPIPTFLGNLSTLVDLALQQNNLTGSIPADLGNLTNLTRLQLRLNELNGSVPAELSKLTNLQWLDLGYNPRISGDLPASLSLLPNIKAPDPGILYNSFIILKTNTSATCPRPTKKNCLGPPPVNTTSQFCQWVCLSFCKACAHGKYVKGNSSGTDVGGQPEVATVLAPPPPSPPPAPPVDNPPPALVQVYAGAPPPAAPKAASAGHTWLPGASTILTALVLAAFRW